MVGTNRLCFKWVEHVPKKTSDISDVQDVGKAYNFPGHALDAETQAVPKFNSIFKRSALRLGPTPRRSGHFQRWKRPELDRDTSGAATRLRRIFSWPHPYGLANDCGRNNSYFPAAAARQTRQTSHAKHIRQIFGSISSQAHGFASDARLTKLRPRKHARPAR